MKNDLPKALRELAMMVPFEWQVICRQAADELRRRQTADERRAEQGRRAATGPGLNPLRYSRRVSD
jgi:hypothetical protein